MHHRYSPNRSAAVVVAIACATALPAQDQAAKPRFEVASVKLCKENPWGTDGGGGSPGRLTRHCTAVVNLIREAYAVFDGARMNRDGQETKVEGGPAWAYSELYEIQAKADGAQNPGVMQGPMMQSLLEDRFHLKIHRETREVPVYVLSVAKGGLKLPAAKQPCFTVGPGHPRPDLPLEQLIRLRCGSADFKNGEFHMHGTTLADLAYALRRTGFDRKVVDRTGVSGQFDVDFRWSLVDRVAPTGDAAAPPSPRSTIDDYVVAYETALAKFGLRLDPGKAPGEFIVIDRVERPSGN